MPSKRRCIFVRLSDDLLDRLDALVLESGRSRSLLISELVLADFDRLVELTKTIQRRRVLPYPQVAVTSTTATNSQ